ncbi:MarR family winged helix-turn-helix transcriptional regulator [Larkinella soli]|uniref:MarR family winged helix-turn-helix transcriptional regulator n=1 Tax=Larkinella soli TaxID=1770527 RepID=UPI0013E35E0B|nr:MarR family transcriptional regulator [Larkinella soli]
MTYLHVISHLGEPTKSELITYMLSEYPSGIEIIKRLGRLGLVEELADEADKRARRVRITPAGTELLLRSYERLEQVGHISFDWLAEPEKRLLAGLLQRLDDVHSAHYRQTRSAIFEEVYGNLLAQIKHMES